MSGAPFDDRPGAWPAGPGSYLVVLRLPASRRLQIGRLGRARFPAGLWLYVGSARGPGGLPARLLRHWRGGTRRHWHIDYLRHAAQPVAAAWISGQEDVECRWAGRLASADGFEAGPAGFGASDCRCQTHLFRAAATGWTMAALARRLAHLVSYHGWVEAPPAP